MIFFNRGRINQYQHAEYCPPYILDMSLEYSTVSERCENGVIANIDIMFLHLGSVIFFNRERIDQYQNAR